MAITALTHLAVTQAKPTPVPDRTISLSGERGRGRGREGEEDRGREREGQKGGGEDEYKKRLAKLR